tara:strand:- start:715 stop:915 length:201 start_codon:yes stop_codon:yes gene_type:complete
MEVTCSMGARLAKSKANATTSKVTAEAEAAGEGSEIRSQASEPETTQALICRGYKRPMSISMSIRV